MVIPTKAGIQLAILPIKESANWIPACAGMTGAWEGEIDYQHAKLGEEVSAMRHIKIIVEKHPDGYVACPLGVQGVVVGEGDTYEAAVADVKSAIKFHVESFGADVLETQPPVLEAFVAEAAGEV